MGIQTTIIIRNDAIDQIEKHPHDFVRELVNAMLEIDRRPDGIDIPTGNHANVARVIESHHSDFTAVVASGRGTGKLLAMIPQEWSTDPELWGLAIREMWNTFQLRFVSLLK